ncbi:hypothetical protein [Nonomuraea turcica]|uniref:hypothetical protein n=1 Tax=Nonomuraea sp. G32 TaxID=3067274 RepID=UPI00273CA2E9|nr:hypothetical protein [Nonomuraea sp. G32]MDP4501117.1 hypothetical protein [Nonomuraea sp. G32]
MGLFEKLDKLANAGAGSRMPDKTDARARAQSHTTNRHQRLAYTANPGFGSSRADQRAAEADLIREVGSREAKRLMKDAARKVRDSF